MKHKETVSALLFLLLSSGITGTNAAEKTGTLLRGRISTSPAPAPAAPQTIMTPFGMSLVQNGQIVSTMNTSPQPMPAGTVLIPSAMGPVVMGPRGEFRGSLASLVGSRGAPPIGMGPTPNYSASESISGLRQMYAYGMPYPMTQGMVVMPMGAPGQETMVGTGQPQMQQSSLARVIPPAVTKPSPKRNR